CAASPAAAPGGREADGVPVDPVGPGAARPARAARSPRGVASGPVPARGGAPPHAGRGPILVPGGGSRVPSRVPERSSWRRVRRFVLAVAGRLGLREVSRPALLDGLARRRGRPLHGDGIPTGVKTRSPSPPGAVHSSPDLEPRNRNG